MHKKNYTGVWGENSVTPSTLVCVIVSYRYISYRLQIQIQIHFIQISYIHTDTYIVSYRDYLLNIFQI